MLTQEQLKKILKYDPETGYFTWLERNDNPSFNKSLAGKKAGYVTSEGYVSIEIADKPFRAHRLAWLYETGKFPDDQIDHKDGDRQNNKFSNLREANTAENQHNAKKNKVNTTGYKGVYYRKDKNKYHAQIRHNRERIFLGYFLTPEEAHNAYCEAAKKLFGEFARAS